MSPTPHLRKSLACVLSCSLFIGGLLTITTRQSLASSKSLPHSFTPSLNESSEETAPQAETIDEATRSRVTEAYGKLPLSFEENRGQVDAQVKYVSRGAGYTLFLTPTEAVLALQKSDGKKATTKTAPGRKGVAHQQSRPERTSVLRMKLSGAHRSPAITGESKMGVRTNYFKGNNPAKWQTNVARYERVRYSQVYPGVDMIYYGEQQQLEYDFEVAPGADARRIALEYTGVKRMKIERQTGDLILKTAGGEVRQHKPVAYQEVGGERREVASRYVIKGKRQVRIEVGEYDRTQRLVIDPVLSYSTYLGGNYGADIYGIAADASGNVYVTGITYSTDFPTLNGDETNEGDEYYGDAFVTKLNPNLSGTASLLYSTYLGGDYDDYGYGIAVDASGNAYVTGNTGSTDFPTLYEYETDPDEGTDYDAFVTKLDTNASGTDSLLYSTYLGGYYGDYGYGITVDASGYAYVTGVTYSADFPWTIYQQPSYNPPYGDVFVTKLDTVIGGYESLLFSMYLGGYYYDIGYGIADARSGYVYVTGYTDSDDFPTLYEYQSDQPYGDAFIIGINTNAYYDEDPLVYSTYLGGDYDDYGYGIAVDASGNVYVTGSTGSADFPTLNQYQTGTGSDAFVTKLGLNDDYEFSILYSTYLGGSSSDEGYGIAVDASGNVYVTGITNSADFPTLNQYQTDQGATDTFVTKLNTNASGTASLLYSTYLGGSGSDGAYGIAIDALGNAYVTGYTDSADFPTLNQYQTFQDSGFYNSFVTKLADRFISGRITSDGTRGISGVTVQLSGSQSRTVVTNNTGNYTLANLQLGGDYTVTPTKSGLTFIPSEQSFTNFQANQTNVNFTTEPAAISGKVTLDTAAGAGVADVTITLTRGAGFTPRTVTTASDGMYSFTDVPVPGNYKITPSKTNFTFNPVQLVLNNVTSDQTNKDFVALRSYTISGVVKLGADGLSGVTVKLTSPTPAGFAARTATTGSTGAYSFTNLPAGRDYTVTPTKTGYRFTQASRTLTNLSANHYAVNFFVEVYSISGRITRTGTTTGIGAVTVMLSSPTPAGYPARSTRTTSTGDYKFMNLPAGRNYTIKPAKSGFTFSPTTRSITNLSSNVAAGASTNFSGTGP